MLLDSYSFSKAQINRLFPFYILINKNMEICSLGKSLHKICDFQKPLNISQFFSISSPKKQINVFDDLISMQNQLIVMQLFIDKKLILRGQFQYLENSDEILFLGSPSSSSLEQVKENKLLTGDYAKNNRLVNGVKRSQIRGIRKELNGSIATMSKCQKDELQIGNRSDYESFLFSKESINPHIRINYNGDLLYHNSAASHIDFLNYEDKSYPIHLFFKLIVLKIAEKKESWSFEASSNKVHYSFDCVDMPVEGIINVYARDITISKKYQLELEKLSFIVQETLNIVIITDSIGKIDWVNRAFEQISGYTLSEVKGKEPGSFLQGEDTSQETVAYMRQQIRASKPFTCEVYNYNKSGEGYWVRIKGQSIFDKNGKVINYFAIQEDITRYKSIQQDIQKSEKKYKSLVDNSLAVIITHNLDGKILTSNPMAEKIYGYSQSEQINHSMADFISEDDKLLFKEYYLKKIKKNKISTGILKVITKKGKTVYMLYNNFLLEEAGQEPFVISSSVDITKRVLTEKKLKRSKKATEALAQSKHNFLANMSHEIRTPMNAIIGMSRQLQKSSLNDEQLSYLDIIETASENLLFIINDILDLSKLEVNKMFLEKIAFKLEVVIESALKVMAYKAEEKGIQLTNSYFDAKLSPVLIGDPHRINQILLNVLSNAIKFTELGGVDICCNVLKDIGTSQYLEIKITDTGIGMDPIFLKKIFKKFTQEYEAKASNFGGTGLGMAITKSLVDKMGGEISVESKINVGTTIRITFTLDKADELDLKTKNSVVVTSANLKGKKILVVDDNRMNRMVAKVILKDYDVIISEAINGEEAVNYLKSNPCDLVLMDIQMPVLNGHQASEVIRQELKLDIPIIALTANAMKGEKEKCLQFGMNDYVSKPFDEKIFLQIIGTWIGDPVVSLS